MLGTMVCVLFLLGGQLARNVRELLFEHGGTSEELLYESFLFEHGGTSEELLHESFHLQRLGKFPYRV